MCNFLERKAWKILRRNVSLLFSELYCKRAGTRSTPVYSEFPSDHIRWKRCNNLHVADMTTSCLPVRFAWLSKEQGLAAGVPSPLPLPPPPPPSHFVQLLSERLQCRLRIERNPSYESSRVTWPSSIEQIIKGFFWTYFRFSGLGELSLRSLGLYKSNALSKQSHRCGVSRLLC